MQREVSEKRPYRKKVRAEQEQQTRLRITEAAVALHGSVGPARTTVSEIAKRAGVERVTVYRHFPDEAALYGACSAHWIAAHPLPDPEPWHAGAQPADRLRAALTALYAYYGENEAMLANNLRDAEAIPALAAVVTEWRGFFDDVARIVLGEDPSPARRAHVALALDFRTWRLLVRERGLADADAVELMTRTLACA